MNLWFQKKASDVKSENAPNVLLQPFNHQLWKLIGLVLNDSLQNETFVKKNKFMTFTRRFGRNTGALIGFWIIILLIAGALIIPLFSMDPRQLDPNNRFLSFFQQGHILGTDDKGRDIWSNLWNGLRFSLGIAASAAIIDVLIGTTLGIIMGHFEMADKILQFIIKVISNIPLIIVMILITIILSPSFWVLVGSMVVVGWIGMAQQIRAQIKRAKNFEWVTASKVLGTPSYKILINYIPVVIPMLITQLVFTIPGAILAETSLAFIGLSLPNTPTLGNLISSGSGLLLLYPRYIIIPSFVLVLLVTSIQLMGNGVQNAVERGR